MSELSIKEIQIADRHILTGDKYKAVQHVFPKKGDDAAKKQWSRLSTNVHFIKLIDDARKKAEDKLGVSIESLLSKLKNWYESDLTEAIGLSVQEIKEMPTELRQMVIGFKHTKTNFEGGDKEVIEVKFVNKEKIGEMLAKHIGFYETDNKQKGGVVIADITNIELPYNGE